MRSIPSTLNPAVLDLAPNPFRAYQGKRILITGGMGFIGSNLALRLAALEAQVSVMDSLVPGHGANRFNLQGGQDRIQVHTADVRDRSSVDPLVEDQEIIFSLAGQVSHIDSMRDPFLDLEVNCRSQLSLLEACRWRNPRVKVVYAGTRQVYGRPEYLPLDERHPVRPCDVNGINKVAGEMYHLLYYDVYGIRSTSLRLTNTFGPRQLMQHNRQGFAPWFIRLALDGKKIQLFGDGQQQRDFLYVDDVVDAFLLAGLAEQTNGQAFNLGGRQPCRLQDFVELLIEICGTGSYEIVPFPEEKRRIDIGDAYSDSRRFQEAVGWRPRVSLEEGLRRTVAYYRQFHAHYWNGGSLS